MVVCSQADVLRAASTGHFKIGIHVSDSNERGLMGLQEASAGFMSFLDDDSPSHYRQVDLFLPLGKQ